MADDEPKAVKVLGKTASPQCYAIRDFLYRNDVTFEWTELRTDEDASAIGLEGRRRRTMARLRVSGRHTAGAAHHSAPQRKARVVSRSVASGIRPRDLRRGPAGLSAAV
jgi:hypothetical protein